MIWTSSFVVTLPDARVAARVVCFGGAHGYLLICVEPRPQLGLRVGDAVERALRACSSRPVEYPGPTPGCPVRWSRGLRRRGCQRGAPSLASAGAMSTAVSARRLLGRGSECAALDQLVASVRGGPSRALVLRGEAGVGKSALLEYLVAHASGCGIARATGCRVGDGARVRGVAAAVRAVPAIAWSAFPARSAMRLASRSVCATATRRIGSSSAWRS